MRRVVLAAGALGVLAGCNLTSGAGDAPGPVGAGAAIEARSLDRIEIPASADDTVLLVLADGTTIPLSPVVQGEVTTVTVPALDATTPLEATIFRGSTAVRSLSLTSAPTLRSPGTVLLAYLAALDAQLAPLTSTDAVATRATLAALQSVVTSATTGSVPIATVKGVNAVLDPSGLAELDALTLALGDPEVTDGGTATADASAPGSPESTTALASNAAALLLSTAETRALAIHAVAPAVTFVATLTGLLAYRAGANLAYPAASPLDALIGTSNVRTLSSDLAAWSQSVDVMAEGVDVAPSLAILAGDSGISSSSFAPVHDAGIAAP